jgi:hypothetical protein
MDPSLKQLESLDTESATHLSLWYGGGGFFVGFLGVGISIYSLNTQDPNIWVLTLTGWGAALLIAVSLGYVASKLVRLAANQARIIKESEGKISYLKSENARLIDIDSYVISTAIGSSARRSQQVGPSMSAGDNPPQEG